jgi:hypothetical protein
MANQPLDYFSRFGNGKGFRGYPLPSRSSGIIALAGNREIIYGLQSLAGKILSGKELEVRTSPWNSFANFARAAFPWRFSAL